MTTESFLKECAEIQSFLEINMSDDPVEAEERSKQLAVYMARTGKMLADAKQAHNAAKTSEIMEIIRKTGKANNISHTVINELVKSSCRQEQHLVDWIDRLNATCKHHIDLVRTLMANTRAEMQMNTWGGGGR